MINVSNEFRKLMNTRTDFKENAEITFANGTVLELKEKDFTISNNSVTDASETNGIPLGVALCRSIQIELMNDDDRFSSYDFFGARIRLYLTFQLSKTVEKIEYGTFTVLTPETYGETVIITALDDMYKADRDYSTKLVFPATIKAILVDACNTMDISLGTTSFLNDSFIVQSAPADITFRQLFGYIAMIAGGNARIDVTGRLRIITYDFDRLSQITSVIDGGIYSPWNNPTDLDGGSFSPWNVGDVADGGTFADANSYHTLSNWSNLKVDTDDVVITGVQTTYTDKANEEHTEIYGTEGYTLNIENPLIAGQEEYALGLIGNVMVGIRFRQFSGDLVANPTIEFMDVALISDRKGNMYASFITDINFQFFGFTNLKNSAEPTLRNSAKTYSDATKTLVAARKLIKNERTAREQAVAQLAKDLKNSSGLFMTEDVQPDGSTIYYMHDKPTLAESMIVWKLTALAFGISTDGGKTYPYGFTVDGTTITRLLYAEGIDADYINTGAIRIADTSENELFYADYDTKEVRINADKVLIGSSTVKEYVDSSQKSAIKSANNNTSEQLKSYSTTVAMNSAILAKADEITLNVSKVYETKTVVTERFETAIKSGQYAADKAESNAKADTTERLKSYSTTTQMNSAISTKADEILLSASKTYETITESDKKYENLSGKITVNANAITAEVTRAKGAEDALSSKITQTAKSITAEVTRAKGAEDSLSSRITQTASSIELKVSKGDVSSQLSVESGAITIKSNRFSWDSTYSSLDYDGKLRCSNIQITGGTITIPGETLGNSTTITKYGIDTTGLTIYNGLGKVNLGQNKYANIYPPIYYGTDTTISSIIVALNAIKSALQFSGI